MKICRQCKENKDESFFYKDKGYKCGYASRCKICKDKSMEKWRDDNRDRYNKNMRDFRANNKELTKNTDLKRTHGITLEDYNRMLVEQDYKCKICRRTNPSTKRTLAVDHDHTTGEIRGLLCYGCNRALHVLDTPDLLSASLDYLKKKV